MRVRRLCLCAILLLAGAGTAAADDWIPGYVGANRAYVPGYWRSDANPVNNYSNLQNVNPYTARPPQKPAQNYSGYADPNDDGSAIDDGDSGEDGDAGDGGDGDTD